MWWIKRNSLLSPIIMHSKQAGKIKKREQKDQFKKNDCHFKGLYKIKSNFSQFLFSHWLLYECFFSFFIKAFVDFQKLMRFHRQAFIRYKNGDNLKILKEVLRQKRYYISNVILAFLDHLKPKAFFFVQPGWPT